MNQSINLFVEGPTEREVCNILRKRRLVSASYGVQEGAGRPFQYGYEAVISGIKDVISSSSPPSEEKYLTILDRENLSIDARREEIEREWGISLVQFNDSHLNVFEYRQDNLHIVLHISNGIVAGINNRGDFDGYILQLLQGGHKGTIAQALLGNHPPQVNQNDILNKAEQELTGLMARNGYPWQTAKAWLYAYITVFQLRQSHVWFARRVVEVSPEDELKRVFASLIAAWDRLIF